MPFVDLRLDEVKIEKPAAVPAGDYTWQLLPGALVRINKYTEQEELNVSAAIAEGEFAGRRAFWNYPDPTAVSKTGKPMTWSAQALKKLELSLGIDVLPGENAADYLNRVANSNNNRFGAALVAETRKDATSGEYVPFIRTGETEPRTVLSIFSVHAAA